MTSSCLSSSREAPAERGRPESVPLDQRDGFEDAADARDVLSTRAAITEIARAAAAVVAEMDQQRRLDLIVERAVTLVGGVAGALILLDPTTQTLVIRASYGYAEDLRERVLPAGTGVSHRVVAERRAVLVDDYRTEVEPTGYIDPAAYGSTIGVPVVARGELLGALVIQSAADSRR